MRHIPYTDQTFSHTHTYHTLIKLFSPHTTALARPLMIKPALLITKTEQTAIPETTKKKKKKKKINIIGALFYTQLNICPEYWQIILTNHTHRLKIIPNHRPAGTTI